MSYLATLPPSYSHTLILLYAYTHFFPYSAHQRNCKTLKGKISQIWNLGLMEIIMLGLAKKFNFIKPLMFALKQHPFKQHHKLRFKLFKAFKDLIHHSLVTHKCLRKAKLDTFSGGHKCCVFCCKFASYYHHSLLLVLAVSSAFRQGPGTNQQWFLEQKEPYQKSQKIVDGCFLPEPNDVMYTLCDNSCVI